MWRFCSAAALLALVAVLALQPPRSASAAVISGLQFALPLDVAPGSNAWIESASDAALQAGAGYVNSASARTYARDVVGLWPFDTVNLPITNAATGAPVNRTTSPSLAGVSATITGTSTSSPLVPNGRFGSALAVGSYNQNWAQVLPSPWPDSTPVGGFSMGLWFRPASSSNGTGVMLSRQYNNADLVYWGNAIECRLRNSSVDWEIKSIYASITASTTAWTHVLCTFDPVARAFTLYVNGTAASSAPFWYDWESFKPDEAQPLGIGNYAGIPSDLSRWVSNQFVGALDDVVLWSRAITAAEVAALYISNAPLAPAPGPSMTTVLLEPPTGTRHFEAVRATWAASPSASALRVQLSTDRGRTWCDVRSGVAMTDEWHGGANGTKCLFPAGSAKLRVIWQSDATLSSLSLELFPTAPGLPPRPPLPLGMNLDLVTYWSRLAPFTDAWQSGAASNWGFARAGYDGNGWPLELVPSLDNPPGSDWWVPGRNLLLQNAAGSYPAGTYTLVMEGNGSVVASGDAGWRTLSAPGRYDITISNPTSNGIELMMTSSTAGNNIRRISLYMPGQAPPAGQPLPALPAPGELPPESAYNPTMLATLRNAGVKRLRFMDWGNTNNNNVAHWADRNTPSSASQARGYARRYAISSIQCLPAGSSAFHSDAALLVQVTTATPHNLVTGQKVSLLNTDGWITTSTGEYVPHNTSWPNQNTMVHVTGPNTLIMTMATWNTPSTAIVSTCSASTRGQLQVWIQPGVSFEHMIGLANAIGADAWISVPHLATDDFVRQLATLARDKLQGKLYLEYSNEVWNWMFDQAQYSLRMGAVAGYTGWERAAKYYAKRSVEVYNIFYQVYGAATVRQRVVRVLAVQLTNGQLELQTAASMASPIPVDAFAIAPYFGLKPNEVYARLPNITVDEVLDIALDDLGRVKPAEIRKNVRMAQQYGVSIIGYEGGQHLTGSGYSCGNTGCENIAQLEALFTAANRDPRMGAMYDAYYRMWARVTGNATFFHYSFVGHYSKWGSWGTLEYLNQTAADSPKWAALQQYFQAERDGWGNVPSASPPPSSQPSSAPSSSPPPLASSPPPVASSPPPVASSPPPPPPTPSPPPPPSPSPPPPSPSPRPPSPPPPSPSPRPPSPPPPSPPRRTRKLGSDESDESLPTGSGPKDAVSRVLNKEWAELAAQDAADHAATRAERAMAASAHRLRARRFMH